MRKLSILLLFAAMSAASSMEHNTALRVGTIPSAAGANERQLTISASREERLAMPGLSTITELASTFSSTAQKAKLWLWLQMQTNPKDVFKALNLKQLRNTGTKLEKSPELLDWLRYTMAYRKMLGSPKFYQDGEIYLRLLKVAPERDLATFFQALYKIPDLKVVGENLQTAQYKLWRSMGMNPSNVADALGITKLLESGKIMSDPRYIVYFGYTEVWLGKLPLK
ncbi:hypothetical protein P3T76_004783 [Phytophthora citrophthora]|uniref:RXLR phytopathogen effector protein WY-domain domain-containing protein n=1 Tax=Phytophthora citrophthora TaxID=4793 RepID=A0AAD9LQ64_9STRA|nr:hypothetical protein P3T76_004783 [Phytophthora citrophthora]